MTDRSSSRPSPDALDASDPDVVAAVAVVRRWATGGHQSDDLEPIARALVALRARFDHAGHRDWSGKSYGYRRTVTTIYDTADLDPGVRRRLQSALRYHVGNLLRDSLDRTEMTAAGLRTTSPKGRVRERVMQARPADVAAFLDELRDAGVDPSVLSSGAADVWRRLDELAAGAHRRRRR